MWSWPGCSGPRDREDHRAGGAPWWDARASVSALAAVGGAYVIAFARAHLTDVRLAAARAAMRAAVAEDPNADRLHVDIYDRDRLARWTRVFPGVSAWTLGRVGRQDAGWTSVEAPTPDPPGSFVSARACGYRRRLRPRRRPTSR